jgi:menaquinol-cytochrome c reductase iron-sulfur subunit
VSERRTVLKVVAGCATAAVAGVAVVPSVTLVTESGNDAGPGGEPWIRVARLDALEQGKPTRVTAIGAEIDAWTRAPDRRLGVVFLIRDSETSVRALSAVCPHLGCTVETADPGFLCRCHDSVFAPDGAARTGPSPRGLDPLPVRITDGAVYIQYLRFRLGTPERVRV